MIRKANCMLHSFYGTGPKVLTRPFQSLCPALYGSALQNISCEVIQRVEVTFSNILRKIWILPCMLSLLPHSNSAYSVACLRSIYNVVYELQLISCSLFSSAMSCPSWTIKLASKDFTKLGYTSVGFNSQYGNAYLKSQYEHDLICADE